MRFLSALALLAVFSQPATAEIASAYSDLDSSKNCATFAMAEEGEGDYANMICAGYMGYPVIVYYADARESLFYGFPPGGDLAPAWESFSGFNSAGPKIEWRLEKTGDLSVPFATIHRRFVADPADSEKKIEVLVVSKVGKIGEQQGCTVGLVLASGNPQANETARRIADEQAQTFACGADERVTVGEVPEFSRAE